MDNEQIPYLSAMRRTPVVTESVQDEADYSTLLEVKKIIDSYAEGLYKNFNAFDLSKGDADKLFLEVLAHQRAYELIVPLQSMVNAAIETVDEKGRG